MVCAGAKRLEEIWNSQNWTFQNFFHQKSAWFYFKVMTANSMVQHHSFNYINFNPNETNDVCKLLPGKWLTDYDEELQIYWLSWH